MLKLKTCTSDGEKERKPKWGSIIKNVMSNDFQHRKKEPGMFFKKSEYEKDGQMESEYDWNEIDQ